MAVPFHRVDGDVRVTDRVSGTSVRVVCRAVIGETGEDSFISVAFHTALSGDAVPHRHVEFLHHGIEAESVRELRCVLRAFDAVLRHLPPDLGREDIEVHTSQWEGPEPCDVFGERPVASDGDEGAPLG